MTDQLGIEHCGQGEPLTLIHGWGMNRAVFESFIPFIEADYRITRVDLPGPGQSAGIRTTDREDQLIRLAEALPESSLVGWSMGGLVALQLVKRWPGKFKRLLWLTCNPCFVQRPGWVCAVERSIFEEFAQSLSNDWQATIKRFIGLQLHGLPHARYLIRQITSLLVQGGQPDVSALKNGLDFLLECDARTDLVDLEIPVMAILGSQDKLVPSCLAQEIPLINPRIRVECLAQSAHAPIGRGILHESGD